MVRGKIKNREQSSQIRDYSGLRWGTITPTDIDGFFEINNELFVFIEIKFEGRPMPFGQKLGLERLVDALQKDKKAILIVARHDSPPEADIDAASREVVSYRFQGRWVRLEAGAWKLKEFCDWFIESQLGWLPGEGMIGCHSGKEV